MGSFDSFNVNGLIGNVLLGLKFIWVLAESVLVFSIVLLPDDDCDDGDELLLVLTVLCFEERLLRNGFHSCSRLS